MQEQNMRTSTKCVHAGKHIDEQALGINTPIYASTAHIIPDDPFQVRYPRYSNLITQEAVADKIRILEGANAGLVFSSGMAAITTTLFALLKKGDHAIFQSGLYGGTQHFIDCELDRFGIEYTIVDSRDINDYSEAIQNNTVLIYLESPTNPLLTIIDLKSIAKLASEHDLITISDNTFATPINQNPIQLGIDIVIHSGTKYLNGHSDICCGAVASSDELMEQIKDCSVRHGGTLDPFACYMLERGLKTLGLRIEKQNYNAQRLAEFLTEQQHVKNIYYPGLPSHPGHEVAKSQMKGYGGMLSFELGIDMKTAKNFTKSLQLITPAVSLGGVETILCFPAETSHADLSQEERLKQGITDSLIRLSVGIEDIEDLIADIENALTFNK